MGTPQATARLQRPRISIRQPKILLANINGHKHNSERTTEDVRAHTNHFRSGSNIGTLAQALIT